MIPRTMIAHLRFLWGRADKASIKYKVSQHTSGVYLLWMLLTTAHTSAGVWVVGGHFNNTSWCQTCKNQEHLDGIFIWFPQIEWPRSGYIIYFEGGYEKWMLGDRATKRPKYCHLICPFVVPSNIVLVATILHGYCCMGAPLTACLGK